MMLYRLYGDCCNQCVAATLRVSSCGVAAPSNLDMPLKDMNIAFPAEGIDLPNRSSKVDSLVDLGHKLRRCHWGRPTDSHPDGPLHRRPVRSNNDGILSLP